MRFLENQGTTLAAIRDKKTINDGIKGQLKAALKEFKQRYGAQARASELKPLRIADCVLKKRAIRNPQSSNPSTMPSLQDLRRRVRAVKNMRQITKAMKMVAAARLRRAQERVVAARPYTRKMMQILGDAARRAPDYRDPLLAGHEREGGARTLILA